MLDHGTMPQSWMEHQFSIVEAANRMLTPLPRPVVLPTGKGAALVWERINAHYFIARNDEGECYKCRFDRNDGFWKVVAPNLVDFRNDMMGRAQAMDWAEQHVNGRVRSKAR